jgi:UDP-GlcNAc:undecaprenyl-phosphate GlcNAc-1-phosphate transferase
MAPLHKASTAVSLLVPIVALGLPIFDTLFSMVRRYIERRPVFAADRGHVHHRLIDMGITHRRAVATLYVVCVVLAASAVAIALGRDWEVGLGLLGASVVVVGLVRSMAQVERSRRIVTRTAETDERTAALRQAAPDLLTRLQSVRSRSELQAYLEALRVAVSVDGLSLVLDDADLVQTDASPDRSRTVLTVPVGQRGQLELRHASDVEVGPRAEALLTLVADQLALVAVRVTASDPPRPSGEATSSETRTPS